METTPQPQQANTSPAPAKAPGNVFAAISYLPPFLFLVTTFVKGKTDDFAFWHAKRGAALAVVGIIAWAIGYTAALLLSTAIIANILYLGLALTAIFLAWKAWKNERNAVPVLDKLAAKIPLEKLIGKSAPAASTPAPAAAPMPSSTPAPAAMPAAAPVSTPVTNTVVEKKEEVMAPAQAEPVGGMSKPADAPVVAATTPAPAAVPANPAPAAMPTPAPQAAAPAPMPETPAAPTAPAMPATPTQNPPAQQ